jgi:hypothetical protein
MKGKQVAMIFENGGIKQDPPGYLSCKKRRRLQSAEECKPSPFIQEIPGHLLQAAQPISQAAEEEMTGDILRDIRARLVKSK